MESDHVRYKRTFWKNKQGPERDIGRPEPKSGSGIPLDLGRRAGRDACLRGRAGTGAQEAEEEEAAEQTEVTEQTELEDAPVVPQQEIEEIVVTGSRIARTPGELAGNLVVLGEEFIQATGETTLERVMRQLPQNLNSTSEQFGSALNNVGNFTGASTVNLRGLGSESTLVLIDGKRIGYNGFLGGVTDISKIPLSMVERIEVILDGASAIYGSDAVGGVVNIITRKDYEGVELDLNFIRPAGGSYDESRGSIAGALDLEGTRVRVNYSRGGHSGLDAADREATLHDRPEEADGPQDDIRFCCLADGTGFPVLYRLDGDVLTLGEYNALSPEDQARATGEHHAILPQGFNANSSVVDISQFEMPNWGDEIRRGIHVLPEETRDSFTASVERDFGLHLSATAHVRYETRDTTYDRGYLGIGGASLNGANPFNPFGRVVHLRGQRRDLGPVTTESQSDTLNYGVDFEGSFNENWDWEAGIGISSEETDSERMNTVDGVALRAGLNSNGLPGSQFLFGETAESCAAKGGVFSFGFCRVPTPPIPPANPWGDLSSYIAPSLLAASTNGQTRFDALVRGGLWEMPAGEVRVLLGYSRHNTTLDSQSEFQIGLVDESPLSDVASFNTEAERANQAIYTEAMVPLMEDIMSLSLSARWDSYGEADVTYRETDLGTESTPDIADPGDASTWGAGLILTPLESFRFRLNAQTAFVAPQLNQLLRTTSERAAQPFRGLLVQEPDGRLTFADTLILDGGNPDLKPETADTFSFGLEFSPVDAPGLVAKVTWSSTEFKDRISRVSNFIIDRNNPPTNTMYSAAEDVWFQDRRWINVSSVNRAGVDYEVHYSTSNDLGDWTVQFRHSKTSEYDVVVDPATDQPVSVLGHTFSSTAVGVVSPSATTAQLIWSHPSGLEASLDFSARAKTGSTRTGVTNTYQPPEIIDVRLAYDIGQGTLLPSPNWAKGARVSFTINNLNDSYGESTSLTTDGYEVRVAAGSPQFGRVYNLIMHLSL